jgi:cation:H+ antiporter
MSLLDFTAFSLWVNLSIFAIAAAAVWWAGSRLTRYLDVIAEKTGMGEAFAGMLLMGGITSLPEIAAVSSSAFTGNAALATNNLLGSVSINVVLIAAADAVLGRDAITSTIGRPTTLMQGALVIIALALVVIAILVGDVSLGWLGAWPLALLIYTVFAFWMSSRYADHAPWRTRKRHDPDVGEDAKRAARADRRSYEEMSLSKLVLRTVAVSFVILLAGFILSQSADAVSKQTGLGSGFVGLVLVAFATSLPELSSITTAVRLRRYEMALGDVFGTNLLTLGLIFLADVTYAGGPVLNQAGRFEAVAALLGLVLTSIFLIGLLERSNRTIFRMGYDALAALVVFGGGLVLLYLIQR